VAQTLPPRRAGELARHRLTGPLAGFDMVLIDAVRTSSVAAEHRHPGAVLGYILDGQLRFGLNNEAPSVVPTGATFFEPQGALHTTNESVSADTPVRFLACFIVPTESPLVGA
jgi:quercetin dioxygenase-like cupin family protein